MSCIIKITFQHPKEDAVLQLRNKIIEQGGVFEGDTNGGDFSVPSKFGWFVVSYEIYEDLITINVIKKPLVVGCSRIQDELEKFLSEYDPETISFSNSFFVLDDSSTYLS